MTQIMQEILLTEIGGDERVRYKMAENIAKVNLLGSILKLPTIVEELKKQYEIDAENLKKYRDSQHDPLNLEGEV